MPRADSRLLTTAGYETFLRSTASAAFACNEAGDITAWNRGAAKLLGDRASQVLGKKCFDVIRGRDVFGNRFCSEACAVKMMRRRNEPIHPYEMLVTTRSGEMRRVGCSVVDISGPGERGHRLIHLLQAVEPAVVAPPDRAASYESMAPTTGSVDRDSELSAFARSLTQREIEVLSLIAVGTSTRDVALGLGISRTTVSNHIQHILAKLRVHSRLQAVFAAQRAGVI